MIKKIYKNEKKKPYILLLDILSILISNNI